MTRVVRIALSCLVAAVAVALCLAVPGGGEEPLPSFEQIVEQLNSVNPALKTLVVDQTAIVHWMGIFHLLLRTTVYAARPALYKVVVHEAPAILRPLGDTFYLVSSPEQVLADYRASSIRQGAENTLVLELAAGRPSVNPPSGTAVIDAARWLMQEVNLNYQWGRLKVHYNYAKVEGSLLPDTISIVLVRFPVTAELTYTNYRLNTPIDPSVFAQDPPR